MQSWREASSVSIRSFQTRTEPVSASESDVRLMLSKWLSAEEKLSADKHIPILPSYSHIHTFPTQTAFAQPCWALH